MAKFRKKPVIIDAIKVSEVLSNAQHHYERLPEWVIESHSGPDGITVFMPEGIYIKTLEGEMFGSLTAWLIRGVQGEIYPCAGDIFEATYEPVGQEKV